MDDGRRAAQFAVTAAAAGIAAYAAYKFFQKGSQPPLPKFGAHVRCGLLTLQTLAPL